MYLKKSRNFLYIVESTSHFLNNKRIASLLEGQACTVHGFRSFHAILNVIGKWGCNKLASYSCSTHRVTAPRQDMGEKKKIQILQQMFFIWEGPAERFTTRFGSNVFNFLLLITQSLHLITSFIAFQDNPCWHHADLLYDLETGTCLQASLVLP